MKKERERETFILFHDNAGVSPKASFLADQGTCVEDGQREPGVCHQWRDWLWKNDTGVYIFACCTCIFTQLLVNSVHAYLSRYVRTLYASGHTSLDPS